MRRDRGKGGAGSLCPYFSRGSTVKREKFQTHFYEPPLVAPVTVLTGDELTKRIPGEQLGQGSAEEREASYLMRDMKNLDIAITRTEEFMASSIIFSGSCPIEDFDSGRLLATTSYLAKDGSTAYYVPTDKVLVACSANSGTMNYSGVAQPSEDQTRLEVVTGRPIPFVWFPDDSDVRKLRLASRPLPVPPSFNNWSVLDTIP